MKGKIKYFNGIIGKISGDDGNIYFVHRCDLLDNRSRFVIGREVIFEVVHTDSTRKYNRATNVSYIRKNV